VQLATRFSETRFLSRTYIGALFDLRGMGGPKTFFRKSPRHCTALVRMVSGGAGMVSGGAGMLNPSRLGARAAVEAVSIVHDIRYVA
jgi:hypothetical protein